MPLIYGDPPWLYSQGGRGSTDGKYVGMSVDEIHDLPVHRLAARDAVLFLWGTWPFLPVVLATFPAWGFEYKTCAFLWVKYRSSVDVKHVGGGFWTRANTEFCLIGVRGKNHPKRINKAIRQLIETSDEDKTLYTPDEALLAPLGEHSAKPPEARQRIVELMGDLPRIELFARERAPGWHVWGDDPALGEPDVDLNQRST